MNFFLLYGQEIAQRTQELKYRLTWINTLVDETKELEKLQTNDSQPINVNILKEQIQSMTH